MNNEFITREVNNCFTGMFFRNYELLVITFSLLMGTSISQDVPYFEYSIVMFIVIFILTTGTIRGRFIRKGLRYHIYKDKIELYVAGELYRTHKLDGMTYKVRWHGFGKCLEFKPGIVEMIGSDFVMGVASDTLKGTAELIIYRCKNIDEVLEFIEN